MDVKINQTYKWIPNLLIRDVYHDLFYQYQDYINIPI